MEATTTHQPTASVSEARWQRLGGDRFYTLARWMVVVLLLASSTLLTKEPLWPPLASRDPVMVLVWVYTALNILMTVALFARPQGLIRGLSFVIDLAVITLLMFFNHANAALLYPLYLLPLIGAAIQLSQTAGLLSGVAAAVAYTVAYLLPQNGGPAAPQTDLVQLVGLALHAATLIFIPWLTGGLSDRTSTANRASVVLAEHETARAAREAKTYRDQMQSLYEVAYTLSTTMNYQSVLDVTLTESRKITPYRVAMVLLSTGTPDELFIAAGAGLTPDDHARRLTIAQGELSRVIRSGSPALLADVSREPELQPVRALQSCRACCIVPLRAGLHTYGALLLATDASTPFTQEQLGMVTALANYAIIALHNAQLVQDLREERTKLISKEEEVRHQLARDLHDGPAQALAAIAMNAEFIKRLLDRDPTRVLPELDKLSSLAKRTTHEVRTMLFELRPLVLETQGLDVTLRQYFERFQGAATQIILESEPISANLETKVEGTLFNIIQESVNNAMKHAQAKHIWVRLKQTSTSLETTVQDDGRGFDLQKVRATYEQRGSFGLLNIEERAKLIGGVAELHSAPGQGTTVRVMMPLT
ncbi:MAG TPA: GAF domain-containing sensor histidine kinase [Roseiflexaceae bacterium]|nr:GAF domain-containing sensor histidine kinase [Roseiflexaceae bacterium]